MENNGWNDISTCPKPNHPEDARTVLIWHIFQGFMTCSTQNAGENRFNVYWRELPDEWIDLHDRLPTKEDADEQNCILIADNYGEIRAAGWRQVTNAEAALKWAPRPEPPLNYRELRATAQ